ncbi:MAG TPA: ATP-binding cassette domain-containing protein [Thermoanaerobaculia bacterium]|jgi:ABC-2 type transport system ATP-binding protein|nr:ATP-binding cassette domain-containing protein [Thermoanaerobaculia bacterium]
MTSSLELRDVRKSYGSFVAVDRVSLTVPPGILFGLLGPNGAGKTSTIRMIMDITAPDSGEVLFFGRPRQPGDLRRVGYLPEERGLYRKMTVLDQLIFLGEIRGLKRRELVPKIERWLERVDLAQWSKSKIEELSKGMQQKVQLIGTLLHEPDILILDEPFSGLDPLNQGLFKDLLVEYRAQGRCVVLSTHGMELAERMCDQIALISHGRVVLGGELKAIKRQLGGNSYRLVADGDLDRIPEVPGVEQSLVQNGIVKLLLAPQAEGPDVLRELVSFLRVHEFRSEEPELEQIFLKAVRDAA